MPARLSGSAPETEIQAPDGGLAADLAQHADRIGQRELLAGETGDETAAADLAATFEPAVDAQQLAPRRQPRRLAFDQTQEHDAVAVEQRARRVLDGVGFTVRRYSLHRRAAHQRPASGLFHAEFGGAAAPAAAV